LLLALATLPLLPYHNASLHLVALLLAIFKDLLPPSHCCFVVLLLVLVPCYFALSVGTPSISCASGRAWNITNKLHPTTSFFLFPNFSSFFFLYFVCCLFLFLFIIFLLS
jgi:hypothetical protein